MHQHRHNGSPDQIRIGFVSLVDCAPLAVARELGFFDRHGLRVHLVREPGWASIRDKIVYGELEAAHAVAGLSFAIDFGLGTLRQSCVTGFLFNAHGNAITLSSRLIGAGVRTANDLAVEVRTNRSEKALTLGVVHAFSSHNFLLRDWLRRAGILAGRDVQIVVVPPSLMGDALAAGHIDGCCVGEPYNSLAVSKGLGGIVATSAGISWLHPEKALIVRRTFAEQRHDQHLRLIAALHEACVFCDRKENHPEIAKILARPEYLDLPAKTIRRSFENPCGDASEDFHIFNRHDVNRPTVDKANWVLNQMGLCGLIEDLTREQVNPPRPVFREDLYEEALGLLTERPSDSPAKPRSNANPGKPRKEKH